MHIQRCQACEPVLLSAQEFCPHCLATEVAWTPVSGRAPSTPVTMHRAYTPAYEGEIPYNLSLVDLDEGVRVWTNVIGIPRRRGQLRPAGEVVYEDVTPDRPAKFRPLRP